MSTSQPNFPMESGHAITSARTKPRENHPLSVFMPNNHTDRNADVNISAAGMDSRSHPE